MGGVELCRVQVTQAMAGLYLLGHYGLLLMVTEAIIQDVFIKSGHFIQKYRSVRLSLRASIMLHTLLDFYGETTPLTLSLF